MKYRVTNIVATEAIPGSLICNPPIVRIDVRGEFDSRSEMRHLTDIVKDVEKLLNPGQQTLTIKDCIFNGPATIIIWSDNTKTIVKCRKDVPYDREKAFMAAYMKKLFGNGNGFKKEIKRWVK